MNQNDLVASAAAITPVPAEAVTEFEAKREVLVARINARMLERPDILRVENELLFSL